MTTPASITFRRATAEDAAELIANIRPEDQQEIILEGHFQTAEAAIRWGLANSEAAFSARIDGELLAVFGAVRQENWNSVMVGWALGTTAIRRHARDYIRATPAALDALFDAIGDAKLFVNAIPATYPTYRKWAERHLAAQFSETSHITPSGAVFTSFGIWRKGT